MVTICVILASIAIPMASNFIVLAIRIGLPRLMDRWLHRPPPWKSGDPWPFEPPY